MNYETVTDGCNVRVVSDLEAACELVRQRGWATGHAGNAEQLVREVLAQADELIARLEEEVSRLRQGAHPCDC
jgi:hypothetical protein